MQSNTPSSPSSLPTNRTLFSYSSFASLIFYFQHPPSALCRLSYRALPPHHFALLVQSGRMLARTVRIVTACPYFQPVTPRCPVGCCPVGIWCSRSRILGLEEALGSISFSIPRTSQCHTLECGPPLGALGVVLERMFPWVIQ